jgi:hypothetical protein
MARASDDVAAISGESGRRVVAALFRDRDAAERAIRQLQAAGFAKEQIGVAARDPDASGSQAAEGAAAGAISGGVLGGVVGLLIGIGALAIPGVGPVVAGGALASALGVGGATAAAGAGIGAAAGGVLGGLIGMGIPEDQARHFEAGVLEGRVLVTVDSGQRWLEARNILEQNGADIGPRRSGEFVGTPTESMRARSGRDRRSSAAGRRASDATQMPGSR